ncbi:lysylphosphatidylglycerol synthase transmembrane domain-containing protein [Desulfoferrobacter suflitae]|uniref:lysylphosphatidylglycerol synthase transmembrane domain-containing protein n=1 Tax=Desulfoferrobacter suflitae TaxID=2865782 RepID=UPI00216489AF|nr:lysylphosphatidylglycerol synthase transmembrane domain-containing protein [Desulfoferrobacter suflitae]MCK8600580.1 flippase-like domain-containing protein [Desulfoferrobacter suflitae]
MAGITRKRFWFAAFIGLFILYYTIKQADLKKLITEFQDIDLFWGFMALVTSALSYSCIAAVLHRLLKNMGRMLPFYVTFQIALLSCTMNYLMALGGLSGVAAKVYLLSREKIPPSNTLSISMVHGFLTNTVAVVFIYLGFFFLYSNYKMDTRQMEFGIVVLLVAFILTWLTVQILVHEAFRKQLWQWMMRLSLAVPQKFLHPRWLQRDRAAGFFENFNDSMNMLIKNARNLAVPAGYALMDWLLMFLCLKCSFLAAHYPIDNSSLLVGFSVGIFATLFSLTPASIGIMEGSMAGSFYLMGLDYDRALMATLIYRFAYYVLPIIISLFYYKRFFPDRQESVRMATKSEGP